MTNAAQNIESIKEYFKVWVEENDDKPSLYAYRNPFGAAFSPLIAFLYGIYKGGEERRNKLRKELLEELGATKPLGDEIVKGLQEQLEKLSRPEAPAQAEEREERPRERYPPEREEAAPEREAYPRPEREEEARPERAYPREERPEIAREREEAEVPEREVYPREEIENLMERVNRLEYWGSYVPSILSWIWGHTRMHRSSRRRRSHRKYPTKYDLMPYIF